EGAEIPSHRFVPGNGPDIKRWLIDITDPDQVGLVTRKFKVVIEASWGQGTTKTDRLNNVERLPEYNIKEAYDVQTNLPQTLFSNMAAGTLVTFQVRVLDWQAGTVAGPGQNQVNCPSNVYKVSFDLPGLPGSPGNDRIFPYAEASIPTSGTGVAGDPYVYDIAVLTQPGPDLSALVRSDPYLALIRVEDDYQRDIDRSALCQPGGADADGKVRANFPGSVPGQGRLNNTDILTPIDDFVAYRIVPVFVRPAGPPTITLNTPIVDQSNGLVRLSGTILGLDVTTLSLPSAQKRLVTSLTQVGPGGPPMNTPWTLPLQTDQYGRFVKIMPLLPGGGNGFTVTANNQYTPVPTTSNASYPLITWNVDPTTQPSFRVSLAWEPQIYDAADVSDLDLHSWIPQSAGPTLYDHLYYCNALGGNSPGTSAKPCGSSPSVVQVRSVLRDDNGFGPEVMDGINNNGGLSLTLSRAFPLGVNYFTNRRNSAAHPMNISVRITTFYGTPDLQIITNPALPPQNRENFNNPLEFYGGSGLIAEYARSWWRPADLNTDGVGQVSIGPAAINEALLLP
ncbi:MAG: hypothetical protein ABI743_03075, partial [bacterium]